jgi:transcriptional regulator with XRE-family HTH domain
MTSAHDLGGGSFVAFLKAAMEAARIPTGARLAELAGLNPSIVNRWLNGKAVPAHDALRAIAPHLGIPMIVLVVRAGYMTAEEAGLEGSPTPPTGNHTLEDEIRNDPRIRDDRKEPLIQMIQTLFEDDPEDRTNLRDGRSA